LMESAMQMQFTILIHPPAAAVVSMWFHQQDPTGT
jgi:hypothetical protein